MESNSAVGRPPRTDEASARHARELRQKILTAARDVFVDKGYDAFSMRQIAQRIGYSATTIYLHFRDRDEILFAIVADAFERFKSALETAAQSTSDPIQRLERIGTAYLTFALENPADYQIMFMQRRDLLMRLPLEGHTPLIETFGVLNDAVDYAIERGVLVTRDKAALSDLLWAWSHGLASLVVGTPMMSVERLLAAQPMFREVLGLGAGWVDEVRQAWAEERQRAEEADGAELELPPTIQF